MLNPAPEGNVSSSQIASSVEKRALHVNRFLRRSYFYDSARAGFGDVLSTLGVDARATIMLPAFIGWSNREGSGVMDPVTASGAHPVFYRMDRHLRLDLESYEASLIQYRPKLVLIIHYYGYPEPNAERAALLAKECGAVVVEDEAHAMLSDLIGGVCGRTGDLSLFSLHKILPLGGGGAVVANSTFTWKENRQPRETAPEYRDQASEYDLFGISNSRRENVRVLLGLLESHQDRIEILRPTLADGVVPQTLPILVPVGTRDHLYFSLNELGYGVTSLYHTLVSHLRCAEYDDSVMLSRRILNLPVHQDVNPLALAPMVQALSDCLEIAQTGNR